MYSTIVVDCQTKTDTPYCEDCALKKTCLARFQRHSAKEKSDLSAAFMLEVIA